MRCAGRLGQGVENLQVQDRLGPRAEGDGLLPVGDVERDGVGQGGGHFLEGADQGPLEGGAAVLLQGFFRHEQGEQFALGDLQGGEIADFLGVMVAFVRGVVGQGQFQPVAHEFQVAVDGFGADLQARRRG